ncbi:MAG: DUF1190 domain-containing protein [Candidatus Competibacterales bacterium]
MAKVNRARRVGLVVMGGKGRHGLPLATAMAGVIVLPGCGEPEFDGVVFANAEECEIHFTLREQPDLAAQCADYFALSQETHDESAPKYTSLAACEAQHGDGQCEASQVHSGGSFFMPFMAGYLMAQFANRLGNPQPLYKNTQQSYVTGGANPSVVSPAGVRGATSLPRAVVLDPPSRATVATTRVAVQAAGRRGGFGASARGGIAG